MSLSEVKLLELPKILDPRGNLSFLQNNDQLPFTVQRVYWIYDVPGGDYRGGHAYHSLQEVIISLSGSFDVVLHDGREERKITLNRSYYGLYVPKMIWRQLENFSTNSLAFIAADQPYSEQDYIRDFEAFKQTI
ncbi:WxcM-like domain-containing protein [Nostoc ellipsosporum NOK]|jgi:dTDP-4-dehydrorhamnose 3,5-epimerase-like enzyme|nr:WxcM-like domain-containing protein [Nostoc ellipsosporum NOK]